MKIYYISDHPPYEQVDLDPRRRNLYGSEIIFLGDATATTPSCSIPTVDVGPIWSGLSGIFRARQIDLGLADRIRRVLSKDPAGVLIIGNHHIAAGLLDSRIPFVFDPTDSMALYFARRIPALIWRSPQKAANSFRLHLYYRRLEVMLLKRSTCFLTTGTADEQFLRRIHPQARVLRIGNGTDLIQGPPVTQKDDGATIGFHGGMHWEPNRETARRLAGPIAAEIAKHPGPKLEVRIAGRPIPEEIKRLNGRNGVRVDGFVEDVREWMGSLSLYVMPMYLGAGVKNKLIEAMALGIPVLTNARGAEALNDEGRRCVAIAESDRGVSEAVRQLLANPGELRRMRLEGRNYAENNFNWSAQRTKLFDELGKLQAERKFRIA